MLPLLAGGVHAVLQGRDSRHQIAPMQQEAQPDQLHQLAAHSTDGGQ
ncbi:hypothetical protein LRM40_08775 [Ideonella dechloratans]|nr:hypothetical protein [Ideonella dechloratans]UFU11733.1 hypothetical protein LRM40_08775 [Ideonella dechloratans]